VWNPLAAVGALAARGHAVTVLCAKPDTVELVVGTDWDLVGRVDPRVKVVRVGLEAGINDPLLNRWPDSRIVDPASWVAAQSNTIRGLAPEPIRNAWYPAWVPPALATARALDARTPFDLVIANVLPAAAGAVALGLNAARGTPLVLVERDSWVFDTSTGKPYPGEEQARPLLDEVGRRAAQVWYVNAPLAELHRREFPAWAHKVKEVRNGWDREFLPGRIAPPSRDGREGLVFRYIGTRYKEFPLDLLTSAWTTARELSPKIAASRLELVGTTTQVLAETPGIDVAPSLPKAELPDTYAATDVLVFLVGGGPMITTGKIYEYVATGLPVVSSMVPGHDARAVLDGHPLWFDAAEHTSEALARAFVAAAEHVPTPEETANAHAHGDRFRRDLVLEGAVETMETELDW
jgi:glycosyltransferase involved in cell wall biosynthesis